MFDSLQSQRRNILQFGKYLKAKATNKKIAICCKICKVNHGTFSDLKFWWRNEEVSSW